MLTENTPPSGSQPGPPSEPEEIDPISPEEAAEILDNVVQPYLDDEWRVLDRSAYAARLTRGTRNLDVRVDLLGNVETQESDLTPLQDSGRLMAWVLLLTTLLVVLALATALGII
ncbi:MAG: hypothetical protein GYB65_12285 [Chloroflexi bacterium]|nr:hypothetical protein [Chloroflexota bacterium]